MKVETPQILWHSSPQEEGKAAPLQAAPLYSASLLDDKPSSSLSSSSSTIRSECVLATAGNTPEVNLWRIRLRPRSSSSSSDNNNDNQEGDATKQPDCAGGNGRILQDYGRGCRGGGGGGGEGDASAERTAVKYIISLSRNREKSVNAVKFSPDGLRLAAVGDGGSVFVYTPAFSEGSPFEAWSSLEEEESDVKAFLTSPPCSSGGCLPGGGAPDAVDLSWSSDSTRFAVACLDHSVSVFQLSGGGVGGGEEKWKCVHWNNQEHVHYVQGVSFDPMGVYLASQGSDRTVRVWSRKRSALKDVSSSNGGSGGGGNSNADVRDALASAKFELGKAKTIKYRARDASTAGAAGPAKDQKNKKDDDSGNSGDGSEKNEAKDTKPSDGANAAVAEGATEGGGNGGNASEKKKKAPRRHHVYADESTVESFFRRLSWTSDGAFLVTPAALYHHPSGDKGTDGGEGNNGGKEPTFATYLYARHRFDAPYRVLHGLEKPSIAVRPNPVPFRLPPSAAASSSPLPYRSIFAVLTLDTVLLYDTYHGRPLCIARGLHYAGLNDAAWTSDGTALMVVSTDGYVSVLTFEEGELGVPYVAPKKLESAVTEGTKAPAPGGAEAKAKATEAEKTQQSSEAEKGENGEVRPQPTSEEERRATDCSSSPSAAAADRPSVKKKEASTSAAAPPPQSKPAVPPTSSPPPAKKQKKRIQPMLVSCS